ncbi:MAG: alpha/beta fold hydrolase [Bdellovibrionales bacterium]
MSKIQIGSFEFKCNVQGEQGPLVVLLHGYGGGPLDWHHVVPHLTGCRVAIPNLTPLFSCESAISFSKQVQMIAALLNVVNGEREPFVLVGSSYGGTLSYGLRAHFQSLVQGHILLNPMPLDPIARVKNTQLRMLCGMNMVPGALPLFLKTHMGKEILSQLGGTFGFGKEGRRGLESLSERKLMLISKAVQRFAWIAQHENWSYWSNQLRDHLIPLLLITGGADALFHEKDLRAYQQLVPMSEHKVIEEAPHVMVRTHPELLARHIREFVASLIIEPRLEVSPLRQAI